MEELELIHQARAGSVEAFTELVRAHQHRLRGYVASFVGDRQEAVDDVAQETFLAAYRSLPSFDDERVPFGAWLAGIARHRALHFLRTERRRHLRERDRLDEALADGQLALAEVERPDEQLGALANCLDALPEHARVLLDARYRAGTPVGELARRSGKAESAIRMALSRLRALLRHCIEQRGVLA